MIYHTGQLTFLQAFRQGRNGNSFQVTLPVNGHVARRGALTPLARTELVVSRSPVDETEPHSLVSSERLGAEVGEVFVNTRVQPEVMHLVPCCRGELVQLSGAVGFLRVPSYGGHDLGGSTQGDTMVI